MGILLNLTKEYFKDVIRDEEKIEGIEMVSFTDGNDVFHKNGYRPKNINELKKVLDILISRRGDEGDFNDIDVSLVNSMNKLFYENKKFNGNISGWNTSNVGDMSWMFAFAEKFDGDISGWDVSEVFSMERMFQAAKVFNQNISGWKTAKVHDFGGMFAWAEIFDQDLSGWEIQDEAYTIDMFKNCPIKDEYKPKI